MGLKHDNADNADRIARLQAEKAYWEDRLRQRCDEVEYLRREKAVLEVRVALKTAIAMARNMQKE